jgi:VanZ family protein
LIGIGLFWLAYSNLRRGKTADARKIVIGLLALYAIFYPVFMLLPLNFTLSATDLHDRLPAVRHVLLSWPGFGRSKIIRIALVVANFLAAVPLGLLLALKFKNRSMAWYLGTSVILMAAVVGLKIFVISGTPYLAAIAYTSAGMVMGAGLVQWTGPQTIRSVRAALLQALPLMIPLYFVAVLDVNGLLSRHWRTLQEALVSLDPRSLLPFWNWYIVSKAQAAESQAVHAIMFMPIGIMLSLQRGTTRRDVWIAAILAFLFALLVEVGRWFRPGLAPDFYEAVTAALAAGLCVKLMQAIWAVSEDGQGALTDGGENPSVPEKATHRLQNSTVRP